MATRSLLALLGASAAAQASSDVPTVAFPLVMRYTQAARVATDVVLPYATIPVNYDLGSPDFIMFQSNSTMNWGCRYLGCQGQCNVTVDNNVSYNPDLSTTKVDEVPNDGVYGYGGGLSKMYTSNKKLNETFTFSNGIDSVVIPDVQVALTQYLQQRIGDSGSCNPVPTGYSKSIMGISPYINSTVNGAPNAKGPSIRHNLLTAGRIKAAVQSLWFDKAPAGSITSGEPWIGTGLLGGIDTSKYTGPLTRIPRSIAPYNQDQYLVNAPNMTFHAGGGKPGVSFLNNFDSSTTGTDMHECLIDSGAGSESFNPIDFAAWHNATGIVESPDRKDPGSDLAWPGPCDTIPADAEFEYDFITTTPGKSAVVRVPLRNFHRYQDPLDEARGWCTLAIYLRACGLSRTFNTAVFFAADDESQEIAIAQGGISEIGSGVDYSSVVMRIP